MRALQACVVVALVLTIGCEPKQEQALAESAVAHELASMLKARDFAGAPRLTNFAQLFAEHHPDRPFYPYAWDKRFRRFGSNAGFSNSFYEKYVSLPAGNTPASIDGDLLLMSARPFPDLKGRSSRILVSRIGLDRERYRVYVLPETNVIKIFADSKIEVPKAAEFPAPPPPSPDDKRMLNAHRPYSAADWVRIMCGRIANRIGMTEGHWPTVLLILIILFGAGIGGWLVVRSGAGRAQSKER